MHNPLPFFVTGLPRSRTAWCANWLTTERTLCFHDRPYDAQLLREDRRLGFSGSELAAEFDSLQVACPEAPWLVVLRTADAALEAFKRAAAGKLPGDPIVEDWWAKRRHLISTLCAHPSVFPVTMGMLDEEHVAGNAWFHLLPEIPFDRERWALLKGLNVQQQVEGDRKW